MSIWAYQISPALLAIIMVAFIETVSLILLVLVRRFVLTRLNLGEGINYAVSATVQAIGVFYGNTVGSIAVGVWNTNSSAVELTRENRELQKRACRG